ncbi:MAG TPA: hypothetical protein VN831_15855 [Bradyrhizobium sp.]|nr:hypothetical protein [Bradyrhizobium sp.]
MNALMSASKTRVNALMSASKTRVNALMALRCIRGTRIEITACAGS